MLKRFDNDLEIMENSFGGKAERKRIHSLNSLLKDKTYNAKQDPSTLKRIAKMGSRLFNPWNNSADSWEDNHNVDDNKTSSFHWVKTDVAFVFEDNKVYLPSARDEPQGSFRRPKELHNGHLKRSNQNLNLNNISKNSVTELDLSQRRIIVVKNLPKNSNLVGILSRVSGGPLERVVFRENRELPSIELYFVFPRDARKFFQHGKAGLLTYNGVRLLVEWANETNTENFSIQHPQISKHLMSDILLGATRSLLFVKEIPNKQVPHTKRIHYPDPIANYSKDFNIKNVLMDFAPLGNIVDFSPMISRRLSFCLYFDDVRSTILIKKQCQTLGTRLHDKYKDWSIYYGRDVTDKPCLQA